MQKLSKGIIIEIVWLSILLGITFLLLFIFVKNFLNGNITIHLHDTYVIATPLHMFATSFLCITYIVYFIRAFRNSFKSVLLNRILIIIVVSLVLVLALLFFVAFK